MYFIRNNEEIHLSFKNSEKQRTQALIDDGSEDEKAKGTKKYVIKRKPKFEDYEPVQKRLNLKMN